MQSVKNPRQLNETHFTIAIAAAIVLHAAGLGLWMASPKPRVVNIPVRVLNIKLGDSDTGAEMADATPAPVNANPLEEELVRQLEPVAASKPSPALNALASTIRDKTSAAQPKTREETTAQVVAALDEVARQFVRKQAFDYRPLKNGEAKTVQGPGSVLGNSTDKNAEIMTRYEQLLSTWLVKFQFNPSADAPKNTPLRGSVRVRMDRTGNVRSAYVEKTTRYEELDRAMLEMVSRAKPFPPAPAEYAPNNQLLEFVFPITFTF